MRLYFLILSSLLYSICYAQDENIENIKEYNSAYINVNRYIRGTLTTPYSEEKSPLVIFIMDAGAINRDGNDHMYKNDAFKLLAKGLAKNGIASFCFDKRLFRMEALGLKENNISFDQYIDDTFSIVEYFSKNSTYSKIVLAGHGQGSLIAIKAAQKTNDHVTYISRADGIISIAGNAQSIDQIVIQQLEQQAPGLDKSAAIAFKDLKEKGSTSGYDPALESVFGFKVQPFIKSWMKYTPSEEIKLIDMPILIIQGTKDLQVTVSEAEKLKEAVPNATYTIIDNMNHILRKIEGSRLENHKSYNEHWHPIMPEIINSISNFVHDQVTKIVDID